MTVDIVMPRLTDSMEEGTLLQWLKAKGDRVSVGDELVEIETDKVAATYESDVEGVLIEILAEEGATLSVGSVIARVGTSEEAQKAHAGEARAEADSQPRQVAHAASGAEAPSRERRSTDAGPRRERVDASPVVRGMAREHGLDLRDIAGSGPDGRIVRADIEAAIKEQEEPGAATRRDTSSEGKGTVESVELTRIQQAVARRMTEAKATIPHFYLSTDVDVSEVVRFREELKRSADGDVPSLNDFVVKAAALALREHPRVNGAYRDGRLEQFSRVNIGIAVATEHAVVAPTIFDADQKTPSEIAETSRRLVRHVLEGKVRLEELADGTFTVSNLGMYGIDSFAAVINPPQAAILAVGRLRKQATVLASGGVVARDYLILTLACDHRALSGADGAEFLDRVRDLLKQPSSLSE